MCECIIWISATNRRVRPEVLYKQLQRIPGVKDIYSVTRYQDLERIVVHMTEVPEEITEIYSEHVDEIVNTVVQEGKAHPEISRLLCRYDHIVKWIVRKIQEISLVRDVKVIEKLKP